MLLKLPIKTAQERKTKILSQGHEGMTRVDGVCHAIFCYLYSRPSRMLNV